MAVNGVASDNGAKCVVSCVSSNLLTRRAHVSDQRQPGTRLITWHPTRSALSQRRSNQRLRTYEFQGAEGVRTQSGSNEEVESSAMERVIRIGLRERVLSAPEVG